MSNDQIIACLEQKVILLTKILDLTKQIEVRCTQPDIVLDNFLTQRGAYMERIDKCDRLIRSLISQLPDEDDQKRLRQLIDAKEEVQVFSEEEKTIVHLCKECRSLIQHATAIDRCANQSLKKQYDSLKDKINASRKDSNKQKPIFRI